MLKFNIKQWLVSRPFQYIYKNCVEYGIRELSSTVPSGDFKQSLYSAHQRSRSVSSDFRELNQKDAKERAANYVGRRSLSVPNSSFNHYKNVKNKTINVPNAPPIHAATTNNSNNNATNTNNSNNSNNFKEQGEGDNYTGEINETIRNELMVVDKKIKSEIACELPGDAKERFGPLHVWNYPTNFANRDIKGPNRVFDTLIRKQERFQHEFRKEHNRVDRKKSLEMEANMLRRYDTQNNDYNSSIENAQSMKHEDGSTHQHVRSVHSNQSNTSTANHMGSTEHKPRSSMNSPTGPPAEKVAPIINNDLIMPEHKGLNYRPRYIVPRPPATITATAKISEKSREFVREMESVRSREMDDSHSREIESSRPRETDNSRSREIDSSRSNEESTVAVTEKRLPPLKPPQKEFHEIAKHNWSEVDVKEAQTKNVENKINEIKLDILKAKVLKSSIVVKSAASEKKKAKKKEQKIGGNGKNAAKPFVKKITRPKSTEKTTADANLNVKAPVIPPSQPQPPVQRAEFVQKTVSKIVKSSGDNIKQPRKIKKVPDVKVVQSEKISPKPVAASNIAGPSQHKPKIPSKKLGSNQDPPSTMKFNFKQPKPFRKMITTSEHLSAKQDGYRNNMAARHTRSQSNTFNNNAAMKLRIDTQGLMKEKLPFIENKSMQAPGVGTNLKTKQNFYKLDMLERHTRARNAPGISVGTGKIPTIIKRSVSKDRIPFLDFANIEENEDIEQIKPVEIVHDILEEKIIKAVVSEEQEPTESITTQVEKPIDDKPEVQLPVVDLAIKEKTQSPTIEAQEPVVKPKIQHFRKFFREIEPQSKLPLPTTEMKYKPKFTKSIDSDMFTYTQDRSRKELIKQHIREGAFPFKITPPPPKFLKKPLLAKQNQISEQTHQQWKERNIERQQHKLEKQKNEEEQRQILIKVIAAVERMKEERLKLEQAALLAEANKKLDIVDVKETKSTDDCILSIKQAESHVSSGVIVENNDMKRNNDEQAQVVTIPTLSAEVKFAIENKPSLEIKSPKQHTADDVNKTGNDSEEQDNGTSEKNNMPDVEKTAEEGLVKHDLNLIIKEEHTEKNKIVAVKTVKNNIMLTDNTVAILLPAPIKDAIKERKCAPSETKDKSRKDTPKKTNVKNDNKLIVASSNTNLVVNEGYTKTVRNNRKSLLDKKGDIQYKEK